MMDDIPWIAVVIVAISIVVSFLTASFINTSWTKQATDKPFRHYNKYFILKEIQIEKYCEKKEKENEQNS